MGEIVKFETTDPKGETASKGEGELLLSFFLPFLVFFGMAVELLDFAGPIFMMLAASFRTKRVAFLDETSALLVLNLSSF